MNIHRFFIITTLLFLITGCGTVPHSSQLMSQITNDAQGRMQTMSVQTEKGSCIAEIRYVPHHPPMIDVVHIAPGKMEHLGGLQLNYAAEREFTESDLMEDFQFAITAHCLELITGGYT